MLPSERAPGRHHGDQSSSRTHTHTNLQVLRHRVAEQEALVAADDERARHACCDSILLAWLPSGEATRALPCVPVCCRSSTRSVWCTRGRGAAQEEEGEQQHTPSLALTHPTSFDVRRPGCAVRFRSRADVDQRRIARSIALSSSWHRAVAPSKAWRWRARSFALRATRFLQRCPRPRSRDAAKIIRIQSEHAHAQFQGVARAAAVLWRNFGGRTAGAAAAKRELCAPHTQDGGAPRRAAPVHRPHTTLLHASQFASAASEGPRTRRTRAGQTPLQR